MDLFNRTILLLGKVLDLRSASHEILAANVANVDAPGYVGINLVFEEEIRKAVPSAGEMTLAKTHPNHFPQNSSLYSLTRQIEPTETPFMGTD